MPQGTIRSYSESKRFGFIDGDDGKSYFFHRNSLNDKSARPAIGQMVTFEEHPTPKGMAAREVVIQRAAQKVHEDIEQGDVLVSKSDRCGRGNEILYEGGRTYVESRSPDEAIRILKANARQGGFNALVNLSRSRRTHAGFFNSHNYYTVHKFEATPALVKRVEYSVDKRRISESKKRVDDEIRHLEGKMLAPVSYDKGAGRGIYTVVVLGLVIGFFTVVFVL